jgi:hypothetical protein
MLKRSFMTTTFIIFLFYMNMIWSVNSSEPSEYNENYNVYTQAGGLYYAPENLEFNEYHDTATRYVSTDTHPTPNTTGTIQKLNTPSNFSSMSEKFTQPASTIIEKKRNQNEVPPTEKIITPEKIIIHQLYDY